MKSAVNPVRLFAVCLGILLSAVPLTSCRKAGHPSGESLPAPDTTDPDTAIFETAAQEGETKKPETSDVPETAAPAATENLQTEETDPSSAVPVVTPEEPSGTVTLSLPDDATAFSPAFASRLLSVCTGDVQSEMTRYGFTVLTRRNYNKSPSDASHTCAYTISRGTVQRGDVCRPIFLVAVRGTSAGEWYSNFDIAPSHDNETAFAENFLFTAQDVFLTLKEYADEETDPMFILCGHSRGAACSNLLGVLLNACYPVEDTFVYTFATPNTLHRPLTDTETDNIFNVINPFDAVTLMPMASWGFSRAGTDIFLPGDPEKEAKINAFIEATASLAHGISSYYEDRHALYHTGLDPENGITAYEFMLVIGDLLTGSDANALLLGQVGLTGLLSVENDFTPLFDQVRQIAGGGLDSLGALFEGHYPSVYASLLSRAYPAD